MRKKKLLMIAPLAVTGLVAFAALGGLIVQALWNALLPPLFALPQVSFWQALGLLVLSRILFGGWGAHGGPGRRMRHRMGERCEGMSPEEREKFRRHMQERWGFSGQSEGLRRPEGDDV